MGSAAVPFFDPRSVQELSLRHRGAGPLEYQELALVADRLTRAVEDRWDRLPLQVRKNLRSFAYEVIAPPKGWERVWWPILAAIYAALETVRGVSEASWAFHASIGRLITSILDAVEREQPAYRDRLAASIAEGLAGERDQSMTTEEFREWLDRSSG